MAASENTPIVQLRDDFYRDSFGKIVFIILGVLCTILAMAALSIYLYFNQPPPVYFRTFNEWRVQDNMPIDKPYLSDADLLQWVSNTIQRVFVFDFLNYNQQLKSYQQYFTEKGWQVFLNQLNNYANYNNVQSYKQFVNGTAAAAPGILNEGLLSGKFGWWVQMPLTLNYVSYNRSYNQTLTLQILVVRVPTTNNLKGVAIDNIIVTNNTANPNSNIGTQT